MGEYCNNYFYIFMHTIAICLHISNDKLSMVSQRRQNIRVKLTKPKSYRNIYSFFIFLCAQKFNCDRNCLWVGAVNQVWILRCFEGHMGIYKWHQKNRKSPHMSRHIIRWTVTWQASDNCHMFPGTARDNTTIIMLHCVYWEYLLEYGWPNSAQ